MAITVAPSASPTSASLRNAYPHLSLRMDGSPAEDVARNLEVILRGAVFRSVTLMDQEDRIRKLLGDDEDQLSDYMVQIAQVLAEIAPHAIRHAESLASLVGDASDSLNDLTESERTQRILRPIFTAAGRADDVADEDRA